MDAGYLGVGAMGLPMAGKLMDGGHSLTVHDINEAAMQPLLPPPNRTWTIWPGRSSVNPNLRSVSMCTKISGVPSPRVRKPKPRTRLNHFTTARSHSLSGCTMTCVRCGNCEGWIAVLSSIEMIRKACMPLGRRRTWQWTRAPS